MAKEFHHEQNTVNACFQLQHGIKFEPLVSADESLWQEFHSKVTGIQFEPKIQD
jgi:hypothetical protein